MRNTILLPLLPYAAWLSAVQAMNPDALTVETTGRSVAIAGVLATLTVLVYRLGVWRQEMENTRHNVGAEVRAHRDESAANFARLDRRLDAIDHMISRATERSVRATRWQALATRRLEELEQLEHLHGEGDH